MPGTVLSMQNIYLVKKNYANPPEGDTKPPEDSASMKFVYHQLNSATLTRHYHATFEVQVDLISVGRCAQCGCRGAGCNTQLGRLAKTRQK